MENRADKRELPKKVVSTLASCALAFSMVPAVALQQAPDAWADEEEAPAIEQIEKEQIAETDVVDEVDTQEAVEEKAAAEEGEAIVEEAAEAPSGMTPMAIEEMDDEVATEGDFGVNLHWAMSDEDADGTLETLTITNKTAGTADEVPEAMPDRTRSGEQFAWYDDYAKGITRIVFGAGITKVGAYDFERIWNSRYGEGVEDTQYGYVEEIVWGPDMTEIGNNAFWGFGIKELTVPATITAIGQGAFSGYNKAGRDIWSLETVNWETSAAIPNNCFSSQSSLATFNMSEGVRTIGNGAFSSAGLTSIDLANVETLGSSAFSGAKLEYVDLSGVTSVGQGAFANTSLVMVEGSENVTSWGVNCFGGCKSLASFKLPAGVAIANQMFQNCTALTYVRNLDKAASIGQTAFSGCSALKSVNIDSVASVPNNAFQNCTELTSIKASAATSIGNYAFAGCTALSSLDMPALKTVNPYAFQNCTSLAAFEAPSLEGNNAVASQAFVGCTSLKSVVLGSADRDAACTTGVNAFQNCTALETADLPGITTLSALTFNGCTALKNVILGNRLTAWNTAFDGTAIEELVVPDSVTQITSLKNCPELTTVKIGAGVKSISAGAFADDPKLTNIEVSESNQNIVHEGGAFYGPDKRVLIAADADVVDFVVDPACEEISAGAFQGCKELKSVDFGNVEMTSIPNNVFYGCTSLEEMILPSAETLGNSVFYNCTSLEKVSLPNVEKMGNNVFRGCTSLKEVNLSDKVTALGNSVFYNCDSLVTITGLESIETVGGSVFYGCSALEELDLPGMKSLTTNTVYGASGLKTLRLGAELESLNFKGNPTLKEIIIDSGNTKYRSAENNQVVYEIDEDGTPVSLIMGTGDLSELVIPETVKSVGGLAGCKQLVKVTLPEGGCELRASAFGMSNSSHADGAAYSLETIENLDKVTSIGKNALTQCVALEQADLSGVKDELPAYVFYNCSNLKSVTLSQGTSSIPDYAFQACSSLAEVKNVSNVTSLGNSAFLRCTSLKSFDISEGVTSIPTSCFGNCSHLASVTIPEGVTTIGQFAFSSTALTEVVLPESVTSVDKNAFGSCKSFDLFEVKGTNTVFVPATSAYSPGTFTNTLPAKKIVVNEESTTCKVVDGSLYDATEKLLLMGKPQAEGELVIDGNVSASLYAGNENITKVTIKGTSVAANAFEGCTNLKEVVIEGNGSALTTVASGAFANCPNLEKIVLNGYIPTSAFGNDEKLTDVEFSEWSQANKGFYYEDGVVYDDDSKATVCMVMPSVTDLELPETVTKLSGGFLASATGIHEFTVPESVEFVRTPQAYAHSFAFADADLDYLKLSSKACASMIDGSFPSDPVQMTNLWGSSSSIKKLDLTEYGSETIPPATFQNLNLLTEVQIPGSVETIEAGAFYSDTRLKDIYLYGQAVDIAGEGMTGDSSLGWTATTFPAFSIPNPVTPGSAIPLKGLTFYGLNYDTNKLVGFCEEQGYDFVPLTFLGGYGDDAERVVKLLALENVSDLDSFSDSNTVSIADMPYTGSAVEPVIEVAYGESQDPAVEGRTLVPGKDCTVSYQTLRGAAVEEPVEQGTYIATITGDGKSVFGTTKVTFSVGQAGGGFTDVDYEKGWYADAVTFVAGKGLITGYSGTTKFGVGDTMTRAQLAAIMWRAADPEAAAAYDASTTKNTTGMKDVKDGQWYTGAANWAVSAGVISGAEAKDGTKSFNPNGKVTFEQMLVIIANYVDKEGAAVTDTGVLFNYSDYEKVSSWARGSVAWAIKAGLAGNSSKIDPKGNVKRERAAAVFFNAYQKGVMK